jgi:hypothetical protein
MPRQYKYSLPGGLLPDGRWSDRMKAEQVDSVENLGSWTDEGWVDGGF